jgi:putative ABC transport system permease protein
MSLWRQLTGGLHVLRDRDAADAAIREEVNHYVEEATREGIARGLSPEEARRQARMDVGNAREQVRDYGWENRIDALLSGVRHGARRLRSSPGFTAVSVLTLALGIGASTAIFSVIDRVLIRPLPYPQSDRLVALLHTAPGIHYNELNLALSLYFTYSEEGRVFQDVGMWTPWAWNVTGNGAAEQVWGLNVTHGFLAALGVRPAIGRAFTAADNDPHAELTVMLSDGFWKSRFGGDPAIVGRRILMDGDAYTVIGVLPRDFQFMDRSTTVLTASRWDRARVYLISFCCQGIARLKPGVTLEQANADVARMLLLAPHKFPTNPGFPKTEYADARIGPALRPLKDVQLGDVGKTLWILMGAVGLVLAIACANVANLLLVRADGRRQELAIRAALGAGWGRIAQEVLLESLLLSITGGACGLALAWGALRVLLASDLTHLPRLHEIAIDPTVLAFTLLVSVASGLLFGLVPVFKYAVPPLAGGLRSGGRSLTWSRARHRTRNVLVAVQVALAMVLLVSSGLMIRTFRALRHVDPGFSRATELETVSINIPMAEVKEAEAALRTEEAIVHKLAALGGVSSVAIMNAVPLEGNGSNNPIDAEDHPPIEGKISPIRRFKFISPGYVSTMGARLIAGRDMTWNEVYQERPVALISENMARELWHDPRAAIGKRIRNATRDDWREVIGVVADLRDNGIDQPAPSIVYWPLMFKNFQSSAPSNTIRGVVFALRTSRAGTPSLREEIRQAVASVNGTLPVASVRTMDEVYARSIARTSFTLLLLALAGSMALLLGVVGIYGVISCSVVQRTREVGIRLALGAQLKEVTGVFVRQGLTMSGVGAICGLAASLILTRLMRAVLFEVSPADPITYVAASVALVLAAIVGSYLPARRAGKVDPVEALRAE